MDKQTQRTDFWTTGAGDGGQQEEGEGEMRGESNTETYITVCKIDGQWEFVV